MSRWIPNFSLSAIGAFLIGMTFSFLVFSGHNRLSLSTIQEIQATSNISKSLKASDQRAILKSRNSAVNLMSVSPHGVISSLSGTYIYYSGSYYVLTVAHGIIGDCDLTKIVVGTEIYDCTEYVEIDYYKDYAIIKVEELPNLKAVNIKRSVPRNNGWGTALAVQTKIYYTGYPNGLGPFTIDGKIVGFDNSENIYIHSFAWPGSSGSGVFNEKGQMIGYTMAISVGATEYGIDVLEDIVIVVPLYKINWNMLQ